MDWHTTAIPRTSKISACNGQKTGKQEERTQTQPAQEKKRGKHEKTSVTKRIKHQQNTDDGGQATGEEMRHVQMSR